MNLRTWFIFSMLIVLTGCRSTSDLEVITGFDVERYQGVWYEAARLPHGFEENMSAVSATYSPAEKDRIKVVNKGYHDIREEWEEIEGIAKLKSDDGRGWLKVSFFRPFYGSYKILYLDDAYTQAIVAGPTYGYLWILVRDPAILSEELDALIQRAADFGFDTEELIIVDQSRNI